MSDTLEGQTEFDQLPVSDALEEISSLIDGLDLAEPSTEAVADIRAAIDSVANRLGNIDGDEDDVDSGDESRLQELQERLDEIAP